MASEREKRLAAKLREVAARLRQWAIESRKGGWSTHQVGAQRRLADSIDEEVQQ